MLLFTLPTASPSFIFKKRSLIRFLPAEPKRTAPAATGPGAAAPNISPMNRQPSDPGAAASATKAALAEPPPAIASNAGVTKGDAQARVLADPMAVSNPPITRVPVGPKDLSNPSFPKAKGRPCFALRAERNAF